MKLQKIAAALLVPLNSLLLFLLVFDSRMQIPPWLQVLGRMHPLLLHFPIVLLILFFLFSWAAATRLREQPVLQEWADRWLLMTALSAVAVALMGLFLSHEPGYNPDSLFWHKWGGSLLAFLSSGLYFFRQVLWQGLMKWMSLATALVLLFAAHQGASLTHGENFLLAPIMPEKKRPVVAPEEAQLYADIVQPILDEKCIGCHNHAKAKGELVMETKELLLKGGKDGKLWDTTVADLGLMLRRIHLPEAEKKHMPPAGKPQLTETEIAILTQWIRKGSPFDLLLRDMEPADSLRNLAVTLLQRQEADVYDFAAADEATIQKLSNSYREIYPLAIGSPALDVDFYNREQYTARSLEELGPLAGQVVSINLAHMPVKDADLAVLKGFRELRKLNLNFSSITGAALAQLQQLPHLEQLSVAGTALKEADLESLQKFPALKRAYVWNTGLSPEALVKFSQKKGKLHFDTGFRSDTLLMKLTPPLSQNEEVLLTGPTPLRLRHYIQGAVIRYTTDGTDPDSLHSPIYREGIMLDSNTQLKARAFKAGWLGSDVMQQFFFKSTYVPDSAVLLQPPDPKYQGNGFKTLIDREKGNLNFASGKWLGYRENPAECVLYFRQPVRISNVTLSILRNVSQYIVPPMQVECWGSSDGRNYHRLAVVKPAPATASDMPAILPVECNFSPASLQWIRLKITPLQHLPAWHPGKGEKGWVFLDEIMVN